MKRVVILGHVDHGKSTILGSLLAHTNTLPKTKLEQVRNYCRKNAKPFEYAFLLDAFKAEQEQGITLDVARCFFKYKESEYLFFDAPGHVEFLKNAVTGAFQADYAIVVIDAEEGVQENSRRHAILLSMMRMDNLVVVINKMDLVNYDQSRYVQMKQEYNQFLTEHGIGSSLFLPVSGLVGENIVKKTERMPWYQGKSLLETLEDFTVPSSFAHKPFRMPVQDVYKFTEKGDSRRIVVGFIESGQCQIGDQLCFLPSGKEAAVASVEDFTSQGVTQVVAGTSGGITLSPQIYVKRGELAVKKSEKKPVTSSRIKVRIYCLSPKPLQKGETYILKTGTTKVSFSIEVICSVLNTKTFRYENKNVIEQNDVAECIFVLNSAIAFDIEKEFIQLSRFVIVHEYAIVGGGVISQALFLSEDQHSNVLCEQGCIRPAIFVNNEKRLTQKPFIVFAIGGSDKIIKKFAHEFQNSLVKQNRNILTFEIDSAGLQEQKEHNRCVAILNLLIAVNRSLLCLVKRESRDLLNKLCDYMCSCKVLIVNLSQGKRLQLQSDYCIVSEGNVEKLIQKISEDLKKG